MPLITSYGLVTEKKYQTRRLTAGVLDFQIWVQAFVIALDMTMVVCSDFIRFPFHILVGVKQTFQVHKHEDQMISMN